MSVQQFSVDKAMATERFKELRKLAYDFKIWDGYSQKDAQLLWSVLDVLMENHDGLTWMDREKENRDVNIYPHQHTWKTVEDITLHGKAKWVACSECGKLDCDQINESLALVKSTAAGALANNKRTKEALTKGLEAIGLAHSMILGREEPTRNSDAIFEEAVGALHKALRFMSEEPPTESGTLSSLPA